MLRTFSIYFFLGLAAVTLTNCTDLQQDRQDQQDPQAARCREMGLVPGTIEFLQCKDPENREVLESAKGAWDRLGRDDNR